MEHHEYFLFVLVVFRTTTFPLQCFDPWYSWCTVQGATSRCVDTGVTMGHLAAWPPVT